MRIFNFLFCCLISFFIQGSDNVPFNKASRPQADGVSDRKVHNSQMMTCRYRLEHTLKFGSNKEVMLERILETNFEQSMFNKKFSCGNLFFALPDCAYEKSESGEPSGRLNPYFVLGLLGYQHMLNELNAESSSGSVKMQGEILQNLMSAARQEGYEAAQRQQQVSHVVMSSRVKSGNNQAGSSSSSSRGDTHTAGKDDINSLKDVDLFGADDHTDYENVFDETHYLEGQKQSSDNSKKNKKIAKSGNKRKRSHGKV